MGMAHDDLSRTVLMRRLSLLEVELAESFATIKALEAKVYCDRLTGIGNRRFLEERTHGRNGWFVLVDLDGFKAAQDAHPDGHRYGDEVLREFAAFLLSTCRTTRGQEDRVAVRVGGDEFVVWCPTHHGAKRIKALVRVWHSSDYTVTASVGLGRDMESADAAMYLDKQRRGASAPPHEDQDESLDDPAEHGRSLDYRCPARSAPRAQQASG